MRHRDLGAIAVAATVAATPALATVMEDLATAPPAAAQVVIGSNCILFHPEQSGNTVTTQIASTNPPGCKPGTLSLQSSADHSQWKTLAQTHQSSWTKNYVRHECLAGTSWYRSYFVADDGSFKGGTTALQIWC